MYRPTLPTGQQQNPTQQADPTTNPPYRFVFLQQPQVTPPAVPQQPLPSAQSFLQGLPWSGYQVAPPASQPPTPQLPQLPQHATQAQLSQLPQQQLQQQQHQIVPPFTPSHNGAQAISPTSHNVGPPANASGVTAPRAAPNLFSPPQPHSTQGGSPATPDNSAQPSPATADQVPDSPSEETSFVLQLSSKDFYSPTIQNYLRQHGVSGLSPSLSPPQSTGSGSISPARIKSEKTDPVPIGLSEQVVKPKSKRQLSMKDDAFVPKSIKTEPTDDTTDDDNHVIIIEDDDSNAATSKRTDEGEAVKSLTTNPSDVPDELKTEG